MACEIRTRGELRPDRPSHRAGGSHPAAVSRVAASRAAGSRAPVRRAVAIAFALLLPALVSCASIQFHRETETSGTFVSTGTAVTLFSWDLPKGAMQIARENASDARQPNMRITSQRVFPYLGPLDWIFDIIGLRYARISGTWGFAPPETQS